jgi:hypothetical protein
LQLNYFFPFENTVANAEKAIAILQSENSSYEILNTQLERDVQELKDRVMYLTKNLKIAQRTGPLERS